jgi:hypothetical protein
MAGGVGTYECRLVWVGSDEPDEHPRLERQVLQSPALRATPYDTSNTGARRSASIGCRIAVRNLRRWPTSAPGSYAISFWTTTLSHGASSKWKPRWRATDCFLLAGLPAREFRPNGLGPESTRPAGSRVSGSATARTCSHPAVVRPHPSRAHLPF